MNISKKLTADWLDRYRHLPGVFVSDDEVKEALNAYPGDSGAIGKDLLVYTDHGACAARLRTSIEQGQLADDMSEPPVLDREPDTAEEVVAWLEGWSGVRSSRRE